MKTRIFLVAAALMLFASLGFGQNFVMTIYNLDYPLTAPTAEGLCGGEAYPSGTVYIFQDVNGNGPSADDPQPVVGQEAGNVNFNSFPINSFGEGPGLFYTDPAFSSVGIVPANPIYYLVVNCSDGARQWISALHTITGPGPSDWFLSAADWTCLPCVVTPTCDPTLTATINAQGGSHMPQNISVCLDLCTGFTTVVSICSATGAPFDPAKPPVSHVAPGCMTDGCQTECAPAAGYQVVGPTYDPATGCFVYLVIGGDVEGCACFTFEYFLAANIDANSFTAVPGDNMVTVNWRTFSEAAVNSFAVVRNGEVVGTVAATNPNGANYNYVDRTAVNGTIYTYTLRVNNSDGSMTETGLEVSATPSFGAAVITEYALHQNFPNPFNPTTSITFDVVEKNLVTLKVFNAAGQEVATLANGEFDMGRHNVSFSSDNLTSGLYFYTVKIGNEFSATKKMLLVK